MDTLLDIVGITKSYGPKRVLDGIDLTVGRGEVIGIVGENGAGKTTLISIFSGHQQAEGGTMRLNNAPYWPKSPEDARARGVGIIQQDFTLDPQMTVAAAIFRNTYQADRPQRALNRPAQWLLDEAGVALSPGTSMGELAYAEQGLVEAVRLLAEDAQLVIMDEVAASLNLQEIDHLHFIVSRLTRQGRSVLYISHRLREVQAVANRIAVVREGRIVEELDPRRVTTDDIAGHMRSRSARRAWLPDFTGRSSAGATKMGSGATSPFSASEFGADFGSADFGSEDSDAAAGGFSDRDSSGHDSEGVPAYSDGRHLGAGTATPPADTDPTPAAPARGQRAIAADDGRSYDSEAAAPLLEIEGLDAPGTSGSEARDISFSVASGEVVGLTGPRHAGQDAVVAALNGRAPGTFRLLRINGYNRTVSSPEEAAALRIAYLAGPDEESPKERQRSLARAMMTGGWATGADFEDEVEGLAEMMSALDTLQAASNKLHGRRALRNGTPHPKAGSTLSGGQQQMVMLGDWMTQDADVLIVSDPGRGLDHDNRALMYEKLNEAACNGAAVLLVSSDVDELVRSCQRVLVFRDGEVAEVVEGDPITHEQLTRSFARMS